MILHPTEEDSHSQEEQLLIVLDDLTPLEKWRRKAEEPMEGLADLLAYSEGVFWEADPDTLRFSYVTGAPERLLGFPASQWTAEPDFWIRHLHPQDRQRVLSLARLAVQQGLTPQAVDIRMMGIDGEEVALRNVIAPVRSPDGQVSRLRGYLRRSSPGDAANPGRSSARHLPVNGAQATALALGVPLLAALFWLLRRADR